MRWKRRTKLKTSRSCAALTALVISALVLAACAPKQRVLSDEEAYKRFVGTWVNTEYPGTPERTKVTVIRPDYVGEDWPFPTSTVLDGQWTIKIKKTWVDEKGNTYCQFFGRYVEDPTHRFAALMRVDQKGEVWEDCSKAVGVGDNAEDRAVYPEKIDSSLSSYWIYYRKK
ncbi:MAG: hypothetical protein A2177_07850 [Spirochaetes bacterium RBG_13_68_11]|nr:MAG: hypothetical protein A2177_07850 [Spirochaetes bacterium RBG_13_68_11]